MVRQFSIAVWISFMAGAAVARAQTPGGGPSVRISRGRQLIWVPATQPARPNRTPPTRDPHTAGYVTATELPDGTNPPADADGNFIIGPTHNAAPEMAVQAGVPQGTVVTFTMNHRQQDLSRNRARREHVRRA